MRELATGESIDRFFRSLGERAASPSRVYVTGGATAVLLGLRASTVDIDLKLIPESDEILRAIPRLKEELRINVELAAPDQFIPPLPGWQERSRFIRLEGRIAFYHYDFYAQALAKIQRGHGKDLADARGLVAEGLVDPERLFELFERIEPDLFRYPAIDPSSFRRAVEEFVSAPPR
ncbi:MAG TPA: DUF6036 family nucleotidyltransferase [Thermoanaerobaculia bacterium]|nr:DUF6036 family nucleotidyltransferase [Thermoanaerobaculia bacterium]